MLRQDHLLFQDSIGVQTQVTSFQFGQAGARPKVYVQASLHAEEIPGMLTAHHLLEKLKKAEAQGLIQGEIVVVPVCNPIGLAQRVDFKPMGRFELSSSENFNRHYPHLTADVWQLVQNQLGPNSEQNTAIIRQAAAQVLANWPAPTQLQSLRKTLLQLALDADVVLDLHCDLVAELHMYLEDDCWPALEPLSRLLQSKAVLLAKGSGVQCFDECLSGFWRELAELAQALPTPCPVVQACASTTVELRGEGDVTHELASQDAQAIYTYFEHLRVLKATQTLAQLPAALCPATPLAGSQTVVTPVAGVLVFIAQLGQCLKPGDVVAEVVNPITGQVHAVCAEVEGIYYARVKDCYAKANDEIANIAGRIAFKTGNLLGA